MIIPRRPLVSLPIARAPGLSACGLLALALLLKLASRQHPPDILVTRRRLGTSTATVSISPRTDTRRPRISSPSVSRRMTFLRSKSRRGSPEVIARPSHPLGPNSNGSNPSKQDPSPSLEDPRRSRAFRISHTCGHAPGVAGSGKDRPRRQRRRHGEGGTPQQN